MDSIAFDRAAETYDETRGGLVRGRRFAAAISGFLGARSDVVDVGVGTAAVALPLEDLGHTVVGMDLSRPMLDQAKDRHRRLVEGDATRLSFATACFDAAVAVWVVHVVGNVEALAAELHRVVRPGGVFLAVSSTPDIESNDLSDIVRHFGLVLGRGKDRSTLLAPRLASFGFDHERDTPTDVYEFDETPQDRATSIERRDFSVLWDLDDEMWSRLIRPILDELRALPEPGRARRCVHRHILSAYRRR